VALGLLGVGGAWLAFGSVAGEDPEAPPPPSAAAGAPPVDRKEIQIEIQEPLQPPRAAASPSASWWDRPLNAPLTPPLTSWWDRVCVCGESQFAMAPGPTPGVPPTPDYGAGGGGDDEEAHSVASKYSSSAPVAPEAPPSQTLEEGYQLALNAPYMKLKKWVISKGLPEDEVRKCPGIPSLVLLMRKHGLPYTMGAGETVDPNVVNKGWAGGGEGDEI
jgi:hypothetical protein